MNDICCGDPADCGQPCSIDEERAKVLDQPYHDAEGNEGTLGEVLS